MKSEYLSQIEAVDYSLSGSEILFHEDFLLLQLVDDGNINFGDCGDYRFIIGLRDLVKCDYFDVRYGWDSY